MRKKSLFIHFLPHDLKNFLLLFCMVLLFLFPAEHVARVSAAEASGLTVKVKMQDEVIPAAELNSSALESMGQTRQAYSSLDPMPAPSFTLAEGIMLQDLLKKINIDIDHVRSIKLFSSDGWSHTYTREFLLESDRYSFPDIVTGWDSASAKPPEFLPGTEDKKTSVMPMLALKSYYERFNTDPQWDKITNSEGIRFCFGQENIEEQAMLSYGKYINEIEVVIDEESTFISLDPSVNGQYFQPGSAVSLRGGIRGLEPESVFISVTDPQGTAFLAEKPVAVVNGAYLCSFQLDASALEGRYKVIVSPEENESGYRAEFAVFVSKEDTASDKSSEEVDEPSADDTQPGRAGGSATGVQGVPADTLTIMVGYFGGPYMTKKVFTLEELQELPNMRQAYTLIDSMPAVVIDSAIGVRLTDILGNAGIDVNSVEAFYFYCSDVTASWYETLTKSYLLDTKRYYYPNLPAHWDSDTQTARPGAKADAAEVDTIIAWEDNWQRFGTKPDFFNMETDTRFRLLFGQADIATRTASRSAKWIHAIEVMLGGTPPSGITLDKAALSLEVGSIFQLVPNIGIVDQTTDKRVEWSSSDPSIVEVDSSGRIRVLAEGAATITATTVVGNQTAVCVVNGPQQKENEEEFLSEPVSDVSDVDEGSDDLPGENAETGTEVVQDVNRQYLEQVQEGGESERVGLSEKEPEAGFQPWRVYEMSPGAVALPDIREKNPLNPFAGTGVVILFFIGAIRRIKKYQSEV